MQCILSNASRGEGNEGGMVLCGSRQQQTQYDASEASLCLSAIDETFIFLFFCPLRPSFPFFFTRAVLSQKGAAHR